MVMKNMVNKEKFCMHDKIWSLVNENYEPTKFVNIKLIVLKIPLNIFLGCYEENL